MKKTLHILTVLSVVVSSILFATPSQAATVGGVTVTTSGAFNSFGGSANYMRLFGGGSSNNRINFDFGGFEFSIANTSQPDVQLGIPAIPYGNYDKTINIAIGLSCSASNDIYVKDLLVVQTMLPSDGCSPNRSYTPFVQFNYIASTGVVVARAPIMSDVFSLIRINSDGSYRFYGTITSWVELANFEVGARTSIPGAPTSVSATSTGATTANVSFTAPVSDGGAAITSYTATSSPGGITGSISQAGSGTISMTGLTAGTAYTFTVKATNSAGTSVASSASNSITTVGAPSYPTSVVATATGKRSAIISFGAPSSNNGSVVTSYTAISSSGGITQTLTQATGGTFNFDGLQPGTAYTFAVTATNAIGTSAAATSNSATTTPLVVAALSALSFVDDGTGTGGKIIWSGKNIDAVLYTGSAAYYPGPYNYGAFTSGWNGRIRNLTPGTEYTVSIFAVSSDGVGESKSLTFKTSATLPALAGAKSATISQADQMATQLPKLFTWINENVFVDGEGDRMKTVLNKFDAMTVPAHSAYLKLPNSSVVKVSATSATLAVCKVEGQVTVHSIATGTCTISYTVSGGSKAPATMVKDFVFKKFAK